MNKYSLLGLILGLLIGCTVAKANNVNIQCWSGDHMIFNDIVPEWKIEISRDYVLVNKNGKAHIIIGDCVLSRKLNK